MNEYFLALRKAGLWLKRSFSFLWLIALAVYLTFLATQSVISNYQSQQELKTLQAKVIQVQQEEKRMQALLAYYQTDEYRDLVLRRSLLAYKPGEHVYMLPESSDSKSVEDAVSFNDPTPTKIVQSSAVIWRQWLQYLFHA